MSRKLTTWYPPETKPFYRGVYQIFSISPLPWYRLWDGTQWHVGWIAVDKAALITKACLPEHLNTPWRGLARKP